MEQFHATTIICVRRGNQVAIGGDGQVTLGNIVFKGTARKIRKLYHDRVLAGFAGATADAFTLQERFEGKLEKHQGNLMRAAVELTRDWRTDRVLRRLEAYDKAGAHILFPEALTSEEEMRTACAAFEKPVMANMANGGLTPVPPASVLEELGYAFAIYPSLTSLVAASAMEQCLRDLKDKGIGEPDGIFNFKEFCSPIGFDEVWEFERKWPQV